MKLAYIIEGINPEYRGWLKVNVINSNHMINDSSKNSDELRRIIQNHVNKYMIPAGQSYHLYWTEITSISITRIYQALEQHGIPRYRHSNWFNTDVWTVRRSLNGTLISRGKINGQIIYNSRRLKPVNFAKYLYRKYQQELRDLFKHPNNLKERRFKRNFYSVWGLSSINSEAISRVIKMFSAYLLLRNVANTVPKGCRKMFRKLIPLEIDDLNYDLKILDYKFRLMPIIHFQNQINSLSGKPFGTVEFTNQYLINHVKFLQIFNHKLLKRYFNL